MKVSNPDSLNFREAKPKDINQIQVIRNSVRENMLTAPGLVTDEHCLDYITNRGKGWVCEIDNRIIGFSIADLKERNVWALFVHPNHEKKGVGKQLQKIMLDWYFDQTSDAVWLSTDPGTRAETFYRKCGWTEIGTQGNGEIRFEMTHHNWNKFRK